MQTLLSRFIRDKSGVTAIEYGLIALLITVVVIGTMTTVGTNLNGIYAAWVTAVMGAL